MILKTICFLLILRAGLVNSINVDYNNDNSTFMYNNHDLKTQVDKCAELGIIKNCTQGKPYCFVNGDDIKCGHIGNIGWRISPLDGLVLNNGQVPNPLCTLFIPPEKPTTKEIIKTLLKDSVFGSTFRNNESAWFNIFEYLGNCPWRSQFCDENTKTCQDLLSVGNNCNSSNQCFSHSCELYGGNNGTNSERKCAEGGVEESKEPPIIEKDGLNEEQVKTLSIIITVSVCSAMLISGMGVYLMLQRKKKFPLKKNDDSNIPLFLNYSSSNLINQPNTVVRHLSSLHSSFLSRKSTNRSRSSKYAKRDTSDQLSVLLPPAPTLSRGNSLRVDSYRNSNDDNNLGDRTSRDSFDIYPPPQQYQHENSFHISY